MQRGILFLCEGRRSCSRRLGCGISRVVVYWRRLDFRDLDLHLCGESRFCAQGANRRQYGSEEAESC